MPPRPDPLIRLWLASTNPGKVREFSEAARSRGVVVESLPAIGQVPLCLEDGLSFDENARKKAVHYSRGFDGLVLADDSGLCVDALDGAPGVLSARYAGSQASDEANNAKLIAELRRIRKSVPIVGGCEGLSDAHYECVIAVAERGRVLLVTEDRAVGVIVENPRGSGGFGYDPYFYYPPLDRTFAELTPEAKFAVSHRGKAFDKLLGKLETTGILAGSDGKSPVLS